MVEVKGVVGSRVEVVGVKGWRSKGWVWEVVGLRGYGGGVGVVEI